MKARHVAELYSQRSALQLYLTDLLGKHVLRVSGLPTPWCDAFIIVATASSSKWLQDGGFTGAWWAVPGAPDLLVSTGPRWEACGQWRAGGMPALAEEVEDCPDAVPVVFYNDLNEASVMHVLFDGGAS